MYHSSLVNQYATKAPKSDSKSSTSKCSNMSKCSSSILGDRSISDVKSVSQSGNQSTRSKAFKPLKQMRVHNKTVQEEMRNVYEKYNSKQLDEIQLKNELKHKLFIKLNENELDTQIRNNNLNFKELVKDYRKSNKIITSNQEYFQKPDEQKVQHSQNLWQYRRAKENQNGKLKIDDNEQKKMDDYQEYLKKYKSPIRSQALERVDKYSNGLTSKDQLMKDLQMIKLNVKDAKDSSIKHETANESTHIKNIILQQIREEDIADVRYSPAKNPKQFIENTQYLFKPYNEAENIVVQMKRPEEEENKVIFSSNGIVRLKSLGSGQFWNNSRDNGNIITWHTSQEENIRLNKQKEQEIEKNRLRQKYLLYRKMKSCEFFNAGLETINDQLVPSIKHNKKNGENKEYDDKLSQTVTNQYKSTGKVDRGALSEIKKQQERCFVYDDYVSPVKINYSHKNRNLGQSVNILTWQ